MSLLGVVVGILTKDGNVDIERMNVIRARTRNAMLTFHRAFDLVNDYNQSLEDIISIGCDRLLTSALSPTAEEGIEIMNKLCNIAGNRISIIAAAGINTTNVVDIIQSTSVRGVHIGSAVMERKYTTRNKHSESESNLKPIVRMGNCKSGNDTDEWTGVSGVKAIEIRSIANSAWVNNVRS